MLKGLTKAEISWIFLDWASQGYVMIIMSTIMGLYFLSSATAALEGYVEDPALTANAYWGFGNSFATIIVGLLAPVLGTLSAYKGKKKRFLNFFLFTGVISTLALVFVPSHMWILLLIVYVITAIGFAGSNIFYDAFLVDVSKNENVNRVSSLGFALGYIGGIIPFVMAMALVILAQLELIAISLDTAYRISFVITAVWWIVFSIPFFKNVHQVYGIEEEDKYIRKSFQRLWSTLKEVKTHKYIFIFLIAKFFYIDGISSIIRMATVFGRTIGIDETMLLLVLLITQFVAFPFALIYGKMADRFGAKNTIYFGIFTYCVVCVIALFMSPDKDPEVLTIMFWALAMLVGTAQGGVQALTRSYFARLVPKDKANEFFGFYSIFGRFASVMGTTLFGIISLATGQPNHGIAGIILLFFIAAIIFYFVPDDRKLPNA